MSECGETSNSSVHCSRGYPVASLIGFILILVGAGIFSGAAVFMRRHLASLLEQPHLLQFLDYVVYGLLGTVLLFAFLAYFLCALSSGRNAKRCYGSGHKISCGCCINMTLIVGLVAGVLLWAAIACLTAYPVISATLLHQRQEGPTRLLLAPLSITDLDESRRYNPLRKPKFFGEQVSTRILRTQRDEASSGFTLPVPHHSKGPVSKDDETKLSWSPGTSYSQIPSVYVDQNSEEAVNAVPLQEVSEQLTSEQHKFVSHPPDLNTHIKADEVGDRMRKLQSLGLRKLGQEAESLLGAATKFFRCASNVVDLSYYGLYDEEGLPVCKPATRTNEITGEVLICSAIALAGVFMVIIGHVQIAICVAINYTRLQRYRYYKCSVTGEENESLHQ